MNRVKKNKTISDSFSLANFLLKLMFISTLAAFVIQFVLWVPNSYNTSNRDLETIKGVIDNNNDIVVYINLNEYNGFLDGSCILDTTGEIVDITECKRVFKEKVSEKYYAIYLVAEINDGNQEKILSFGVFRYNGLGGNLRTSAFSRPFNNQIEIMNAVDLEFNEDYTAIKKYSPHLYGLRVGCRYDATDFFATTCLFGEVIDFKAAIVDYYSIIDSLGVTEKELIHYMYWNYINFEDVIYK